MNHKNATIGALAYVLQHPQLVELTEAAVEIGASCPTDEYLADYAGYQFLCVPVANTTEDAKLCAVLALEAPEPDAPPRVRIESVPLDLMLAAVDGKLREQAASAGMSHNVVFLEVEHAGLGRLDRLPEPLPLKLARKFERVALHYLAGVMRDHGEHDIARRMLDRADRL